MEGSSIVTQLMKSPSVTLTSHPRMLAVPHQSTSEPLCLGTQQKLVQVLGPLPPCGRPGGVADSGLWSGLAPSVVAIEGSG